MSDIKVQSGTVDIGNAGGTDTVTAVSALTTAFEFNSNSMFTHGGSVSSGGNMEGDDMAGGVELTGLSTLTISRQAASLANNMRFDWQLIEYIGTGGGDNEFIVRSRNEITLSGASGTAALDTTPTNIDRCVPFITGVRTSQVSNQGDELRALAYINDAGTLVVEKGSTTNTTVVQVVTVEFTGSNWEVYHGTVTSAADTGSITLNTDSDGVGGNPGNVTDWATAFMVAGFTATDQGLDSIACRYGAGSVTQVDWDFQSGNSTSHKHFVHVVRHPDLAVTRYTPTGSLANDTNVDITSAGLTSLNESMIIGTCQGSGGGTAYGRNWRNYRLTSLTNAQHYCHRSGNTILHNIQVIDFAGVTSGGAGTDNLNADDVQSLSETTSPAIGQTHSFSAVSVEGGSEVTQPSLSETHALSAGSIQSAPELTAPAAGQVHNFSVDSVESQPETSISTLGQAHNFTADQIEGAAENSIPSLAQTHALTSADIASQSQTSLPSMSGGINLDGDNLESVSELTIPGFGQVHNISVASFKSASELTSPSLSQTGGLSANDIECITEVSLPVLGGIHVLSANDIECVSDLTIEGTTQIMASGSGVVKSIYAGL